MNLIPHLFYIAELSSSIHAERGDSRVKMLHVYATFVHNICFFPSFVSHLGSIRTGGGFQAPVRTSHFGQYARNTRSKSPSTKSDGCVCLGVRVISANSQ